MINYQYCELDRHLQQVQKMASFSIPLHLAHNQPPTLVSSAMSSPIDEKPRELTHNERLIALGICFGLQEQGLDARKITTTCARLMGRSRRAVQNVWKDAKTQRLEDGTLNIKEETMTSKKKGACGKRRSLMSMRFMQQWSRFHLKRGRHTVVWPKD